jgi:hypothetical protein
MKVARNLKKCREIFKSKLDGNEKIKKLVSEHNLNGTMN